jgi:alpha-ribazole phosphatase
MESLLIRHAESLSNAGGVTLPHADIPLSEHGHEQARKLASTLPIKPSAVLVSSMMRTHQTAAPLCARYGLVPTIDADLDEFSLIDHRLIEGMDGPQRRAFVADYWTDPDPHRRWGEHADTFVEFADRVHRFIAKLDRLMIPTVIVGHGIWLCMLHWQLQGGGVDRPADMQAFRQFQLSLPMPNCATFALTGRAATGYHLDAWQAATAA